MAIQPELARISGDLPAPALEHLQRLMASWDLLADLCFADLMLFVADPGGSTTAQGADGAPPRVERVVVLGQVRPTTGQTLYRTDWVGFTLDRKERPLVARCLELGEIMEGEVTSEALREAVREQCIPVRWEGRTIAVLTREAATSIGRHPGELERVYVEVFGRFARMIAQGAFPFSRDEVPGEESPRVGDGAMVLDQGMRVIYTSPNAMSGLHRMGIRASSEGMRLDEMGLPDGSVRRAYAKGRPATEELELGTNPEVTVLLKAIPLLEKRKVTGALLLMRDVSELRRRDRLLLSKDATIREIHHRVKNNLQTVSSLLKLQGRRLSSPEAKAAIEDSVRRIRSIALVHETLSHAAPGDDVAFTEIVKPLVRMVEESFILPDRPIRFEVTGDAGNLPASIATPLAVVLNEAFQNVVDHAYPRSGPGAVEPGEDGYVGHVEVALSSRRDELVVTVTDDGRGLPGGFDPEEGSGLGLSIVRALVTGELAGTLELRDARSSEGDRAPRRGTTMEVRVPLSASEERSEPTMLDTGQVPVVRRPDAKQPPAGEAVQL